MLLHLIVRLAEASHSSIYPLSSIFLAQKANLKNEKLYQYSFFISLITKTRAEYHFMIVVIIDLHFRTLLKSKLITHIERLKFNKSSIFLVILTHG